MIHNKLERIGMNKIRKTAIVASMLVAIGAGIVGCEWESPSDSQTWSDSYNWVNFSGVYKNPGGGSVVSDFTSSIVASTNTAGATAVPVGPVTIANGDGGNSFSGKLLPNVVPGSLQVTAGGVVFTDNGTGGLIPDSGLGTINGSISYGSGAWSINMGGVTVEVGEAIRASYSVFQTTGTVVTPGSNSSTTHGTTGTKILSLTVMQEGNLISIIDSDGMTYSGKFGSIRTNLGKQSPVLNDVVIGQFSVKGTSRVGIPVEIVGVLQGTVLTPGADFMMTRRSLQGQWIEKTAGGKVGDVLGVARDIAIDWVYAPLVQPVVF